jgi:hypothetical protein
MRRVASLLVASLRRRRFSVLQPAAAPRARRTDPRATRLQAQPRSRRSCRCALTSTPGAPVHPLPKPATVVPSLVRSSRRARRRRSARSTAPQSAASAADSCAAAVAHARRRDRFSRQERARASRRAAKRRRTSTGRRCCAGPRRGRVLYRPRSAASAANSCAGRARAGATRRAPASRRAAEWRRMGTARGRSARRERIPCIGGLWRVFSGVISSASKKERYLGGGCRGCPSHLFVGVGEPLVIDIRERAVKHMPPPLQPPCVEERLLDMPVGQMAGGEPSQLVPYPIDVVNPEQKCSLHLGRWPDDAEYHIFM